MLSNQGSAVKSDNGGDILIVRTVMVDPIMIVTAASYANWLVYRHRSVGPLVSIGKAWVCCE